MKFLLFTNPIPESVPFVVANKVGAVVSFEGRVRNHNEGQIVLKLEYSAYEKLALAEGNRIVEAAIARFDLSDAAAIHRIGLLAIGDTAVRVWATGGHRGEAFAACQWIIDEIKARVPIWKRETYETGVTQWVLGQSAAPPPELAV